MKEIMEQEMEKNRWEGIKAFEERKYRTFNALYSNPVLKMLLRRYL